MFTNEEVDEKYPLNIGIGSQPVISGKATINNKLQGKLAHLLIFHRLNFKIKLTVLRLGST